LPDAYSPGYVEAAWYEWWEKMGFFKPEAAVSKKQHFLRKNLDFKFFQSTLTIMLFYVGYFILGSQ
jgi:hypothetical protein